MLKGKYGENKENPLIQLLCNNEELQNLKAKHKELQETLQETEWVGWRFVPNNKFEFWQGMI